MKNLLPFLVMLLVGCNQVDPALQNEVNELKEKLAAYESKPQDTSTDKTGFIHTVFFWMNDGVTDEQKADFAKNGLGELLKVKSIYKGYMGPAAMTPERGVVDNSYDFALICHFENRKAQDDYQVDPIHLKFIDDYKDLWKKVKVYDNLTTQ
ncbi:MAG: Dabb family protein [Bacteroidota bacterium]